MGLITALAVGGAVAAGAAASAVAKKKAADKAASAQKKGLNQQKEILKKKLDPAVLNDLAQNADSERAKSRLALQKEIDPELAQLRQQGKEQLLAQANIPEESKQSSQLANTLFNETKEQDPRLDALKNSILDRAQSELDAGAELPPEFQGELVRAGLSEGAQSGIGTGKASIGGRVARALGLAGIQLQQSRQAEATRLADAGNRLRESRVNMLATVFPKLRDLETVRRQEAAQNLAIAEGALPESGLSGQDQVNIEVARQKGIANVLGAQAGVKAQQAQNKGAYQSALIGAGTSFATSAIGGVGGAVGGGALGGAGGASNLLGVGGTGATLDVGALGSRSAAQQKNFDFLSSYYQ